MNIVLLFTYIFILLKPFYFFKSGSIQPADYFLIIAFLLLVLFKKKNLFINCIKDNKLYIYFTLLVIVINGIYCIFYNDLSFCLASLYFMFNIFAIILFAYLYKSDNTINNIGTCIKIDLIIQALIFIVGLGKYYSEYRYMGTFNDPNQFGYFVFLSYCYIYLISVKNGKNSFLWLLISMFLIIESCSTGMFLGTIVFLFLDIFKILKVIILSIKQNIKKYTIFILVIFLFSFSYKLVVIVNPNIKVAFTEKINNIKIIERVNEKLKKASKTEGNLWQERGYDRIALYPQYLLYGAGGAYYSRFVKSYHLGEIHATFPSLLFYYGIIPFSIIVMWIYKKLKKLPFNIIIVYIALFAESFILLNYRQSLFWSIIILGKPLYSFMLQKKGDYLEKR